jgi:O-succinylbenzoate synthase
MRIDAIEIRHVAMPLLHPWKTASHEATAIHAVFVRLESEGVSAWGEAAPLSDPTYSPEWASTAFTTIETWLAPALLGEEVSSGEDLQRRLEIFKGNYFAKGVLDCAWWALDAKLQGVPLHRHVGGVNDRIEIGADFGVADSYDTLIAQIGGALDEGFRRVKLKFRPGWDVEMVAAVRSAYPDLVCHVDCNSGYTLTDIEVFRQLDRYELAMIEQPLAFDDLLDHAKLARAIETPICLDETIVSVDRARHAIELEACEWINIKHGRVGGMTNAIAINELCREAGIKCWVGSMLESAVGSALSVAVASREHVHYPADVFTTERHYAEDLAAPEVAFERGADGGFFALAPDVAGIEPEPHPERLEQATISVARLPAG